MAFRSTSTTKRGGGGGGGGGGGNSRPDNKQRGRRGTSPPARQRSRSVSAITNRAASTPHHLLHHFSNKTDNPLFSSQHIPAPNSPPPLTNPSSLQHAPPPSLPSFNAPQRSHHAPTRLPHSQSQSDPHTCNETRGFRTWSSRHPPHATYISNTPGSTWEDAVSSTTLSESEEKNDIKSVLDESQERARKLRAYLAIEEQRGQELNQILNEMLPSSELQETRNSRSRRKASIERRKMSKRLMEEAMMYFDECISISTFDNSDLSAPEETPFGTAAAPEVCSSSNFLSDETLNAPSSGHLSVPFKQKQDSDNISQSSFKHDRYDLATENSSDDYDQCISVPNENREQPQGTDGFLNLRSYVQKFVKEDKREIFRFRNASTYDADEYTYRATAESVLCDVVNFKHRIEYGGLHLCGPRLYCDI